jgi:phospholipid transport system substrate-binding protein
MFKFLIRSFLTLCLLQSTSVWALDASTPDALVRNTTKEVLELVKRDGAQLNDKKIRDLVEVRVLPYFDFSTMTALAVGKTWRSATPAQQTALTTEFRALLIRTYSAVLTSYKSLDVDVKPVKMAANDTDVIVRTEVSAANVDPIQIDYRLQKGAQGWKVYDVSVKGISLVTNYRSNFNQIIQQDGIDGLIKQLSDKNSNNNAKSNKS